MPSRVRLDKFIAVVESGDHAGAIERGDRIFRERFFDDPATITL